VFKRRQKGRRRKIGDAPVMASLKERAEIIEALRKLLDRLCSPDVSLGEAKSLRTQVLILLDRNDQRTETNESC
jgi:hypothetical protein